MAWINLFPITIENLDNLSLKQKQQANDLSMALQLKRWLSSSSSTSHIFQFPSNAYTVIMGVTGRTTGAAGCDCTGRIRINPTDNQYFSSITQASGAANVRVNAMEGITLPLIVSAPITMEVNITLGGVGATTYAEMLYYLIPKPYGVA